MSRLYPLPLEALLPETAAVFEMHVQNHHSRITNMKATMGRSLEVFDIYMRWYDLYEQVKKIAGARSAYLFAHSISLGSNCPLCTTYFRKIIIDNGENPAQLILTGDEQILVDFGAEIASKNGKVSEAIYNKIKARYTEKDLVILAGFAGQMIATNVFSNIFEVEIDDYLAPYVSMNNK